MRVNIKRKADWVILTAALVTASVMGMGVLAGAATEDIPASNDTSRLVSTQALPENFFACSWDDPTGETADVAAPEEETLFSALHEDPAPSVLMAAAQYSTPHTEEQERVTQQMRAQGARVPLRTIRDTAPTYSAVAVDVNSNEVILQDNNLWQYQVFDRLSPTPAGPNDISVPKRTVHGDKTLIEFNNGLYVDPNGDIFSVESDVGDKMVRFPHDASGDVAPKAVLHTPHRVYNLAASEARQEVFATVEFPSEVVVYPKDATGEQQPIRRLEGDNTGLDAPHGIAVDEKDQLLFVNTWGHHSNFTVAGTGHWYLPAIKVYALDADGDAKPLRVITGDSTQLDWPAAMKFNPENGDLYVANDIGQSVLIFGNAAKAQGNVAPARAIHGPSTRMRNPTGVALDLKNREVWVSNLGNSSAAAYPLMANGDVAPLRIIRSAEESKRGVNFGRTAAVTYDPIRQEILVPNCVNHPQIAVFARSAGENTPYLRSIEGQKSLLGRTMHDIGFDGIHDEIVVTSPLAQAILTFRGAANGEEAPIRYIQGDKTQIKGVGAAGKVSIDPVHNEIFFATPDQTILVFDRMAQGNVPPKRVLGGPDTQLSLGKQNTDKTGAHGSYGGGNAPAMRIDPIHNLLIVPQLGRAGGGEGGGGGGKVLVFDRTASGNTPPKAIIQGPVGMGNQFEIYAPQLRLITETRNYLEIWKIPESGLSTDKPMRIAAPLGKGGGDIGIVLDPLHKEVIIATSPGNSVETFSVPEVFDDWPAGTPLSTSTATPQ